MKILRILFTVLIFAIYANITTADEITRIDNQDGTITFYNGDEIKEFSSKQDADNMQKTYEQQGHTIIKIEEETTDEENMNKEEGSQQEQNEESPQN